MNPFTVPTHRSRSAEGLRWIARLFENAAETLERPSLSASPLESPPDDLPPGEFLSDVRHRLHTGGHLFTRYY